MSLNPTQETGKPSLNRDEFALVTAGISSAIEKGKLKTREKRIAGGLAWTNEYGAHIETSFGKFGAAQEYMEGCLPANELSKSVEVFKLNLSDAADRSFMSLIGKSTGNPDGFRQEFYAPATQEGESAQLLFTQEISAADMPHRLAVDEAMLQPVPVMQQIEAALGVEMGHLTVDRVDGLIN